MDILPKISVNHNVLLNRIEVTETTGLYNAETNPFGWGDPNTEKANIESAVLTVLKNDYSYRERTPFKSIDVKNAIVTSDPLVQEFSLANIDLGDVGIKSDGAYILKYQVDNFKANHVAIYINEFLKVVASKMWAELALNYNIYSRKDLELECHWLEMTLLGLDAVARRGQEDIWLNLYNGARLIYLNNKRIFNFKF